MDIKIGDFVKSKDWDVFLEVVAVDYDTNSIRIVQRDEDKIYTAWYNISQGFIKQGEDKMKESNEVTNAETNEKQDEFQVGDVVWDVLCGKGEIISIEHLGDASYPVQVNFENKNFDSVWFTEDGKRSTAFPRSLFFSEPKIEAATTRPFVPTLVGKRVVVKESGVETTIAEIVEEYIDKIRYKVPEVSSQIYTSYKNKITAIYEVQSENLLKK